MEKLNPVLDRVLNEIKNSENTEAKTTSHSSYVSGVFEDNAVLSRVLNEVKNSENTEARTTSHSSYVSGVFED
jgi:hypothetical protein